VSSWAAQTGDGYHHHGYYIIDTATGSVVDEKNVFDRPRR
jgi:hypothetical protein